MRYLTLVTALLLPFGLAEAQVLPRTFDLEQFAEERFQLQDEDVPYEDLYESLLLYQSHPLDLNQASVEDLAALYILSPAQVNAFIEYRASQEKLLSIYELQAIPTFDVPTIRDLLPFVTISEREGTRTLLQRIQASEGNYVLLRYTQALEEKKGYRKNDYAGGPGTLYGRLRSSQPGDYSFGLTFEKDAGEALAWQPSNSQYGFDYYSYHFMLQNKGMFKSFVLGDYQVQFGQGLVLGSGFSAGKGAAAVNPIKRTSVGLRPYTSVLESGYFRGVATTLTLGASEMTFMGSSLLQDARFLNDSSYSNFEEFANSIQQSGLHRTAPEVAARNQLRETSFGTTWHYKPSRRLSMGATALWSHFSKPIQKKPNTYNQFEFKGQHNFVGGLFANYNWKNFIFFGEGARSQSGGTALISGFLASLTPQIDFGWTYRDFAKDYHSFYANAFGESARTINEKGMYWGFSYHPSRRYEWSLYFDRFRFPWLRYGVDAPSSGYEYLSRFTYKPSRHTLLYFQYRQENKEESQEMEGQPASELRPVTRHNYVFNADYPRGECFTLKTRIQGSSVNRQQGAALLQDVQYQQGKWKVSTRFALFETDNYASRQYIYEKDVLYAFSIPAYSGTGTRTYFLVQYNLSSRLTLWLRYARFSYQNVDTVGSGLEESNGSTRSELKGMVRIRL